MPPAAVELRGISKSFGGTRALDDVSLELRAGEVLALAGENGAGKSTLIRILSGVHAEFTGELRVAGARVHFADPKAAQRAGIATIHQELSLIPALSVADNLNLGDGRSAWSWVRPRKARERARALLRQLDISVEPDEIVERLPLAARQLIEIARAPSGAQPRS